MFLWPIYQVTQKVASFEWDPEQETAPKQVQAAIQAVLPFEPYDPADAMVLEIPVVDAVWGLWQAPISELQLRSLEFWSKALPSFTDNYSCSEKQLFAYY